eukprot:scaffold54442_cov24-Tisochrysis_lutea.AAC.2
MRFVPSMVRAMSIPSSFSNSSNASAPRYAAKAASTSPSIMDGAEAPGGSHGAWRVRSSANAKSRFCGKTSSGAATS